MKHKIKYKEIVKNNKLTDFEETKKLVLRNSIKKLCFNKKRDKSKQYILNFFI